MNQLLLIRFPLAPCHCRDVRIRGERVFRRMLLVAVLVGMPAGRLIRTAAAQPKTIPVAAALRSGGNVSGTLLDHNEHGLVLVADGTPHVFAWTELEAASAVAIRRRLLVLSRGNDAALTADDYMKLGRFALQMGSRGPAIREFRTARSLDPSKEIEIDRIIGELRERDAAPTEHDTPPAGPPHEDDAGQIGALPDVDGEFVPVAAGPLSGRSEDVMDVYTRFGERVREVLGESVVRLESDHFLIFTDFSAADRPKLAAWLESMYTALVQRFHLAPEASVFLAKCPVFAFQSRQRFQRFARYFDGYEGVDAVGYTRSIEANGHVHVVLLLQGKSRDDLDRFAYTLVHEGTHAFVHRLFTSRLLPHWVNEGLAELTAEAVLGERCPAKENAALLARQYATYEWPITDLLTSQGPLAVHEYPVAHSVVMYLESLGAERLARLIEELKQGTTLERALAAQFDDLTFGQLESGWRAWARDTAPPTAAHEAEESARLPWSKQR